MSQTNQTYAYPRGPKSEWEAQALAIVGGAIPTTEQDIPMLLAWLQDLNWPGASSIASYLRKFKPSVAMQSAIRQILHSGDQIWVHWVLNSLRNAFDHDFWMTMQDEIRILASDRDEEDCHLDALYLAARHRLLPADWIRSKIAELKRLGKDSFPEDYDEIAALIADKRFMKLVKSGQPSIMDKS